MMIKKKMFVFLVIPILLFVTLASATDSIKLDNKSEIYQKSQDIIYKEHYPGAPLDDPNVAYYFPNRVIVLFKDYVNVNEINGIEIDGIWYNIIDKISEANVVLLEVTRCDLFEFIEKVERNDNVECASLDDLRYLHSSPNDPYYQNGSQWGLDAINCEKAWKVPRNMKLTWLTIIDAGIDADHEDLKGANIYQWDFVENDGIANDVTNDSHGTKVAGIVMARMNNGIGIAGVAGDAPNIEMLKIFNKDRYAPTWLVIKALIYCTTRHKAPSVILMPFGGIEKNEVEFYICALICLKMREGSLLISSVGNGAKKDGIEYPAGYESVIAVGAVDENLELGTCVGKWRSNYNENKRDVDLVAPGINIVTTSDPDKCGNKYECFEKTSAACAFVAGVAMLWYGARAAKKGYIFRKNEPTLCRHALYQNAIPLGEDEEKAPNKKYGWGLVNAYDTMPKVRSIEKLQINLKQQLIFIFPQLKLFKEFIDNFIKINNFI
jgi:subtilisin family serine protease